MFARLFGDLYPTEHARDLADAFLVREFLYPSEGSPFFDFLLHHVVAVGHRGDLGQVGDADDLVVSRYLLQFFADNFGDPSTNATVDLIE